MDGTVLTPSSEGVKNVKSEEGEMLTKPFLEVCKMVLPVLDKFGVAMALVKTDIGGNIRRLENKYLSNPIEFNNLYNMVRVEIEAKTAKGSSSCTNGLLWLTRYTVYRVAMKLAPDRKKFMEVIGGSDDVNADMEKFCTAFSALVEENHKFLASVGMDDLKAS